jgi:teichuronic acid biosynthesis glycosyltransferase TuaG
LSSMTVSIITPSYNSEKFIAQTIESVLNQTYREWELIIVDDKSTDNTAKVIESYIQKDKRIKCILLEENSGPAIARNISHFWMRTICGCRRSLKNR